MGQVGSLKRARNLEQIKEINKFCKGAWEKLCM